MNEARFIDLVLANDVNREILKRLPDLDLPDAWLVSGCLFQTVWNVLSGRDVKHGIKDYDIFYFDPDTNWEAEDRVIQHAREIFAGIDADIELKNQARVHLWYEVKFKTPYAQLMKSIDGIDCFLAPACMVGVQPKACTFTVYAPCGFDDIETMTIRPNRTPNFGARAYAAKTKRWLEFWPELKVIAA